MHIFFYIIYMLCHLRDHALHHSGGLGQLMGVARKRTRVRATDQQEDS